MLTNLAWGITGAGHYLLESYNTFAEYKNKNPECKINIFISRAGEEVLHMYGLFERLREIATGEYLEEIFLEREQGWSYPKVGRFLLKKYDALIITPATSNTVAKMAYGIADTLISNAVAQAVKSGTPVYVVPVDIAGTVRSELPYMLDRIACHSCEPCPPREKCPEKAINEQIDLLKCTGCGICIPLCNYNAISGGEVELRVRDVDVRNVKILRGCEDITVLEHPSDILEILHQHHS
jgi:dihydromethanopterin reductase (acceptor)